MKTRRSFASQCATALRWSVPVVMMLFGVQVILLAFPQLLFPDRAQVGTVAVYHDGLPDEQALHLATAIDRRLQGSSFYDPARTDRVFVFRNRKTYEIYRKLTFSKEVPSGFNLSVFRNSYVCEAVVAELRDATGGQPRFSIWDGDLSHVAAHEIGHQLVIDRIGSDRWRGLPHWKREGLPEYIANIGSTRADPTRSLVSRIGILGDDTLWTRTPAGRRPGWDRVHYEAELMVEFLFEVQGRSLEQILSDRVTRDETYSAMLLWASSQKI